MPRFLIMTALILATAYALICLFLYLKQDALLYFPQPSANNPPGGAMRLVRPDADLQLSVRLQSGAAAVVYFGGNGEDVSQSVATLAQAFPQHALYLLHYRGYGSSSGKPTEEANAGDALALYDMVAQQHREIVVVGRSLGSGVAVRLANQRPAARLVLVTPYDSVLGVAQGSYWWLPVHWLLRDKYESWRYAPKISVPTTLIVAGQDEMIPNRSSEQLFSRFAKGVATYHVIHAAGHNSITASPEYLSLLAEHKGS